MKKKKICSRKWVIRCGILLAVLTLFIGFIFAWNAGLGLPSGYKKAISPFYYYESYASYSKKHTNYNLLYIQFENVNKDENIEDIVAFNYNNEKCLLSWKTEKNYEKADFKIFKANLYSVGSFKKKERDGLYKVKDYTNFIFFDDHYLYYMYTTSITRFDLIRLLSTFTDPNSTIIYSKYIFYRFDLDNGQNEKVSINTFVEKINKYDETIKLK